MANPCVSLNLERDLLDTNFDGYKLSLDSVPVYKQHLEHVGESLALSDKQYSFQHVKAFGLQNLLFGDPWHSNSVYFVDTRWKLMKFSIKTESSMEAPLSVLQLLGASERGNVRERVNCSLVFASSDVALLSTGTGKLLVVETFNRAESLMWKISKQLELKEEGGDLPFTVIHATFYTEDKLNKIGCLLLHVDETNCEESVKQSGSVFKTLLEWLTLAPDANGDWCIESRRQLEGQIAPTYAAVETDNKAVRIASEKPFKLVYDSAKQLESEIKDAMQDDDGANQDNTDTQPAYVWAQNEEEISVQFHIPDGTSKSDISFQLTHKSLDLKLKSGTVLLSGNLNGDVDVDCSTWTLADNILEMLLSKKHSDNWPMVVEGDNRGKFVLDEEQSSAVDNLLRVGDGKPGYNVQQLEECDAYPNEASLMVRFDAETQKITHQVNLGSNQWLMNCQTDAAKIPCICLRHDVDGVVWQPNDNTAAGQSPWEHTATFNALGYVQASKLQQKFSCCSPDFSYCVICDCVRHIYIYRQPSEILSPIRNRKTGREVGAVAKQQLVSLETVENITGIHATAERIFVMAGDLLHVIRVN